MDHYELKAKGAGRERIPALQGLALRGEAEVWENFSDTSNFLRVLGHLLDGVKVTLQLVTADL